MNNSVALKFMGIKDKIDEQLCEVEVITNLLNRYKIGYDKQRLSERIKKLIFDYNEIKSVFDEIDSHEVT